MQLKDTILTVYLLNIYWLVNIKLNRIETEYINLNFEVFFSLDHLIMLWAKLKTGGQQISHVLH